jgi:hypothetical protein
LLSDQICQQRLFRWYGFGVVLIQHVIVDRSQRRISLGLSRDTTIDGRKVPVLQLFYRYKTNIGQWKFYFKA